VITVGLISVVTVTTVVFVLIYTPFYVTQHEPHDPYSVARRVLTSSPLVDGQVLFSRGVAVHNIKAFGRLIFQMHPLHRHNGLPNNMRRMLRNQLSKVDFKQNLTGDPAWGYEGCPDCHTDIPRLREGLLGSQVRSCQVDEFPN
jgi:hypothetical protein